MEKMFETVSLFDVQGKVEEVRPLGPGFINDTLIVACSDGDVRRRYILQRKNHNVFPDVAGMMNNIVMVCDHIKAKVEAAGGDPVREALTVIRRRPETMTETEKVMPYPDLYYKDEDGGYWAMCLFIEGSVTYEMADTPALAYKGGQGIGKFQAQLADFTTPLSETIKGFHNIRWRFRQWDEALRRDAAGRVKDLAEEISWIESRKEEMLEFWSLVEDGTIPTRVTHNDTKLNNILMDAETRTARAVIDLDTIMPGSMLYDFGDSIRFGASTGAEDETDLSKISVDVHLFEVFAKGYLSTANKFLTPAEKDSLVTGAYLMTLECGVRFLTDYLDGDVYFKTKYPGHNLDRAHNQIALAKDILERQQELEEIIKKYV